MRHDHKSTLSAALANGALKRDISVAKQTPQSVDRGSPVGGRHQSVSLAADEWPLADQTWRDWRTAITAHHDAQTKLLTEQAWAAGLLDGASIVIVARDYEANRTLPRMTIEIREVHGDQGRINLMRFQRAVGGAGSILGPYPNEPSGSYCYVWRASSKEEIDRVWKATGPFLGLAKFLEFRRGLVAAPNRARSVVNALNSGKKEKPKKRTENLKSKAVRFAAKKSASRVPNGKSLADVVKPPHRAIKTSSGV